MDVILTPAEKMSAALAKGTAREKAAEATIAQLREIMSSQSELIDDQGNAMTAIARERDAAQAEVERLRVARSLLSEVYNAFGYTWPQSFIEDVGAFLDNTRQDAT